MKNRPSKLVQKKIDYTEARINHIKGVKCSSDMWDYYSGLELDFLDNYRNALYAELQRSQMREWNI